ncbi:hypothetical protein ACFQJ7_12135 [Halovenus rubra]|uniref:Uncharacterized protein n=2 Tax=Halovenus rubra TaxID=869890 RepID=A0ABD5XA45_9EURY|nr:hypothetical protein [Halovenus rubra]
MNVFVRDLKQTQIDSEPDLASTKLAIEDNIGESIHIHWRNLRLEMTVDDYELFATEIIKASEELNNGNC